MSERVVVHIGLPKTGTTYLQTLLWSHRDVLRSQGILLPGRERRDHLLASMIVRDDEHVHRRGPGADQAWSIIREQVGAHAGTAVISHEFFCSADTAQFARLVDDLAPARVEIVITTREPLGLLTSSWQESLKNRESTPLADYGRGESDDPRVIWNWRALDLGLVLQRLAPALPDDQVHLITPPSPGQGREETWLRFARVLDIDPSGIDLDGAFGNPSMGVVEAELLRRINPHLNRFTSARDKARWIRTVLADRLLVTDSAERFAPEGDQIDDARRRADRALAMVDAGDYRVHGDPALLRVPDVVPERRRPAEVGDAELLAASVALNARLLAELRERVVAAERAAGEADGSSRVRSVVRRLRRPGPRL